jgi:hypothetical protein
MLSAPNGKALEVQGLLNSRGGFAPPPTGYEPAQRTAKMRLFFSGLAVSFVLLFAAGWLRNPLFRKDQRILDSTAPAPGLRFPAQPVDPRRVALNPTLRPCLHYDNGGTMTVDFYLQLDGIKGESANSKHKDSIEVTSFNWTITQPKSAAASTSATPPSGPSSPKSVSINWSTWPRRCWPKAAHVARRRFLRRASSSCARTAKASRSSISRSSSRTC